jgi:hypothetical protein
VGDHSHFNSISHLYFAARFENDLVKVISKKEEFREIKFDLTGIGRMPLYQGFRDAVSTYDQIPIEIDNFSIKWKSRQAVEQKISFHFSGPQDFWEHLNSYQIDKKTKNLTYANPSFSIPNFDGEIKIQNISITDFANIRGNSTELKTSKNALVFIPKKELTPKDLKKFAFPALDIFEKQFSMLQRKRVKWFKYQISTKTYSQLLIKNVKDEEYDRVDISNYLVEYSKSLEFVKTTHKGFYKLDKNGFDLISPVNYYLSSLEISYIDASYAMLFFALEKLIEESVTKHKSYQEKIIEDKRVSKKLRHKLNQTIEEVISDTDLQNLISEKIKELNRPSFRRKLKAVLTHYNIVWKDLYENEKELKFISIRNQLFHSNKPLIFSEVYKELIRLRSIFERIVLKLISWDDYSNCPPEHILKSLKRDEE